MNACLLTPAVICAQLLPLPAAKICVRKEALAASEARQKTLTFISWLISLFTGCAGFLLRLFSGGLPFSISGIVPDWLVDPTRISADSQLERC